MRSQDDIRDTMLTMMATAFRKLEAGIPPAQMTNTVTGPYMRFREQLPAQAILQKLARIISGLNALELLHAHGFLQEQGVLQRTLDEIDEDVVFLCLAEVHGDYTELHKEYLTAFWMEEFNHIVAIRSTQNRPMISRKKIRAYNIRVVGNSDPSTETAALRTVYQSYSGFVHAASPQVMDMCIGNPPLFELVGSTDLHRLRSSYDDAWNYFYRGFMAMCTATLAFGDREDADELMGFLRHVEATLGLRA